MLKGAASLILWTAAGCFAAPATESGCTSSRSVEYEPTRVELAGRVFVARSPHPNGTRLTYPVLRLHQPIAVAGEVGPKNPVNVPETCIFEVQLFASNPQLDKKLVSLKSRGAVVRGTLFHGHTAWHSRKIVMSVTEFEVSGPAR
jgi:hypothetical protein